MIEVKSQQGILLAVISLASLGCVYAFCLCCKKRTIIRQEDNILYDQNESDEHNSHVVIQPEKVIRPHQEPSTSTKSTSMLTSPTNTGKIHCSYQNFPNRGGIYEPTYVDPIPDFLYANEDDEEMDMGTYENVILTTEVQHDSEDSYDYENSNFLANRPEESEYANNES
ncbi:LAT2 domain-containing protein isoform X1 [Triplophysa dalaica]|uniref:LAT2 domain-containing protein isoform X1 n=1 Tax=Triplophysa dalaica TaxID=1582913 RepID=UPI0024DFE105|nr:LAT2 domain-containing protein isoform X1 [Triplophysa dalaica]